MLCNSYIKTNKSSVQEYKIGHDMYHIIGHIYRKFYVIHYVIRLSYVRFAYVTNSFYWVPVLG